MRMLLVGWVLFSGAACSERTIVSPDLPDLSVAPDLLVVPDPSVPPDLSAGPDLATGPDLARPTFPACGAAPAPACGFAAPVTTSRPPSPRQVATGDFDGDGKPDILVEGSPYLSVLVGNGDGTFKRQVDTLTATHYDRWQAVADFDGDGKPDVLLPEGKSVTMWLGSGDGSFARGATLAVAMDDYWNALVADVNEDQVPDVMLFPSGLGESVLLLGVGDGTMEPPQALSAFADAGPAVADVDGDGHLDLITASNGLSAAVLVFFGDGTGSFLPPSSTPVGRFPYELHAGDLDGDGKADVVDAYPDGVDVLISQGRTFQTVHTIATADLEPMAAILADFDGDQKLDLVVEDFNVVKVMSGDGAGGFGAPVSHAIAGSQVIAAADFDGDDADDVVLAGANAVGISSIGGDRQLPQDTYIGADVWDVATGDFNADGRPDVVAFGYYSATLSCALQQANGTFSFVRDVSALPLLSNAGGVVAGDFDHDSHLDALVTGQVLLGNGDGTFHAGAAAPAGFPVAVGDFNEDGWPDAILGHIDLMLHENELVVALNDQTGTLTRFAAYAGAGPPGSGPRVLIADVNGDPHLDLIVQQGWNVGAGAHGDRLWVYLGAGDGNFTVSYTVNVDVPRYFGFVAGDFNCDGKLDISASGIFYFGAGDGTFAPWIGSAFGADATGDFNHDGLLDVVSRSGSPSPASISIALGNGDGTVQAPMMVAPWARTVVAPDLDGDGRPDLLLGDGNIQALINTCTR
jgi:FG-GAP-like repeat